MSTKTVRVWTALKRRLNIVEYALLVVLITLGVIVVTTATF